MRPLISNEIIQDIRQRLQEIRQVNGFYTDAGQDVALGWRNLDESFLLPNLIVSETGHQILSDVRSGANARIQLEWTIEGITGTDGEIMENLYRIEADVLQAFYTLSFDHNGLIRKASYAGRSLTGPDDGGKLAAIQIRILTEHAEVMP